MAHPRGGPWSSGAFQRQLFRIFQSRATTGIKERTFSASFSQFVIYVDEVSASQVRLKGLLVSDERNAEQTRERLREVLDQYPPSVTQVLRLDPSLLTKPDYLTTYPSLAVFLAQKTVMREYVEQGGAQR